MTRREFIKRVSAAAFLSVVGALSVWELVQLNPAPGQTQSLTLLPPPTTSTEQAASTSGSSSSSASRTSQSSQTSRSTQSSQSNAQSVPPGYVLVTPTSALSGRTSAYFSHPTYGTSILLSLNGAWKAFSAACTHAGCTVQYTGGSLYCPCHAGYFSASNGSVQSGPPPSPLPEFGVLVQNGNLYVTSSAI